MSAYGASPDLRDVATRERLARYLRHMWSKRSFARAVVEAELQAQHQDSMLGRLWHLLNPILFVIVYYVAFGLFLNASGSVDNYLLFLLIGVFSFHLTQRAVMGCARAIEGNLELIQTVRFPRALLPAAAVGQEVFGQALGFVLLVAVAAAFGEPITLAWLAIVPLLLVQAVFTLGAGLAVARLAFHVRDVQLVLPHAFRLLFYMSAVVYPLSFVKQHLSGTWMLVFRLNPALVFIEALRGLLLHGVVAPFYWLAALVWTVAAVILGFWFFRRFELRYGYG